MKAAADIIREDIRSQVYDTTTYAPSTDFLSDVKTVIPESLLPFLETLILTHKRGILHGYRTKCVALAHSIISVRPARFCLHYYLALARIYITSLGQNILLKCWHS